MSAKGELLRDSDGEIHRALAHPVRRRTIQWLQERNELSFSELLSYLTVPNHGKLGFHIRTLSALGLVEHDPSTRKYRLTEKGQLAHELIWDIRFLTARLGGELTFEPARYVRRIRLGDHAILFYDTENVKRQISFPFLGAGLLRGEAVLYVVSENRLDSEGREIQRYGISVDHFGREAFTIMSADEWYLQKGKAEAETIVNNWMSLLKEKQKLGFVGLRAAAEMEVFFDYAKKNELLRYEASLGRQLASNACALCLYDPRRLDEEGFIQLNKSHGHSIFKGIAVETT